MVGLDVRYWLIVYHVWEPHPTWCLWNNWLSNIYQLPNGSLTVFRTNSDHVQYWDVQLLTSPMMGYCWSTYSDSGIRAKSCMWWKTLLHQNACKRNISIWYFAFLSGYCHCRETLHSCNPPASKWRTTTQWCLHSFAYFCGGIVGQKTKRLVDLTPFKQPLRSFLATELKPQNQTPRSLGHH